jgi:hypothetical protein
MERTTNMCLEVSNMIVIDDIVIVMMKAIGDREHDSISPAYISHMKTHEKKKNPSRRRTTRPVGKCVMRTALSVLLTLCPPAPLDRNVSMRNSVGTSWCAVSVGGGTGNTDTDAKDVCRLSRAEKGEIRINRWTPVSVRVQPYAKSPPRRSVNSANCSTENPFRRPQPLYMLTSMPAPVLFHGCSRRS